MDSCSNFSWNNVDTSLDLNTKPLLRLINDHLPKKELPTSNFSELIRTKNFSVKQENGALVEELKRVSEENKKLTEMLTVMCENYNSLRSQLMDYMNKNNNSDNNNKESKKRKSESSNNNNNNNNIGMIVNNVSESSSTDEDQSCKKPAREDTIKAKISRVHYKTEASDTSLVVKDGYQWRKYGQKVTRDNPSPRAYFKCSFAPTCPVKKKVQRSVEDQSVLVATYEGEHNHPHPSQMEANSGSSRGAASTLQGSVPCAASLGSTGPTITLDLTKSNKAVTTKELDHDHDDHHKVSKPRNMDTPEVRQFLVEQMASSLTKDPKFTAALAAAISGRMLQPNQTDKW